MKMAIVIVVILGVLGAVGWRVHDATTAAVRAPQHQPAAVVRTSSPAPQATVCTDNTLDQEVIVSISKRHLWACNGPDVAYDSPVVTGMEYLAADLTPTGTYHIIWQIHRYYPERLRQHRLLERSGQLLAALAAQSVRQLRLPRRYLARRWRLRQYQPQQ